MQFELQPQDAVFLINVLGKLPTETGAFPIHQALVAQFNAQSQQAATDEEAVGGTD